MYFVKTSHVTLMAFFLLGYLPAQATPNHHASFVKKLHDASKKVSTKNTTAINSADAKDLAKLKGIGPKKAQAIIDYRKKHGKFSSLSALAQVKGMNARSVARLEEKNTVVLNRSPKKQV